MGKLMERNGQNGNRTDESIGKGRLEIKRKHVYELRCSYDDRLGYVVTDLETGRSYAYPDERCYPVKFRGDCQIVQKKNRPNNGR